MFIWNPGLVGKAEWIVDEEHTAKSDGSAMIGVLATPMMIDLTEAAAPQAIEASLPNRCQSLGTCSEPSHVAATPVSMRVSEIDDVEEIGAGTHRRIVLNMDKIVSHVARKTPAKGPASQHGATRKPRAS